MSKIMYGICNKNFIRVMYRDWEIPYIKMYCSKTASTAQELGFQRHRSGTVTGEFFLQQYYQKEVLPKIIERMVKKGSFKSEDNASGMLWEIFHDPEFDSKEAKTVCRQFLQSEAIRMAKVFSKTKPKSQRYT